MSSTAHAAAAEFIATEIAWNGSAGDGWIARKLAAAGHDVEPAAVTAFAVKEGLLKPIPRLGGYTAGRKVNAATFGRKFADFMAGDPVCGHCDERPGSPFWTECCTV